VVSYPPFAEQSRSLLKIATLNLVGIITTVNSKQLIKQLENDGWKLRGSKGCQQIVKK
jgi:hypothetical protein